MIIGLYHPRALSGDGGITRSVRALSGALAGRGYDARVIYAGATPSPGLDSWRGVRHAGMGRFEIPIALDDAIGEVDVLVLHSAWVSYNIAAARAARRHGIPYVLAPRGGYEPRIRRRRPLAKSIWWHLFEKELVEGAAAIHVFFESQSPQIHSLGYDGPLIVAPNGVAVPEQLAWDGGSSGSLVYVGRFDMEHKGLGVLLEGLRLLPAGERPRLILAGPDWMGGKRATMARVEQLDLGRWVEIRPAIYGREKFELMASARGFLYPSLFEAFGNSAAEAASLGVPVLTGTYPLGRYLAERDAGIAVAGDPEAIAEGLAELQGPSASRLGANARDAMIPFTWDSVAEAWASQLPTSAKQRA